MVALFRLAAASIFMTFSLMFSSPALASTAPAARSPETTWVTVHPGESMISLARHRYGSGKYWKIIYDANWRSSRTTDLIYAGERLREPPRSRHHWYHFPVGHHGGIKAVSHRKYLAVWYAYTKIGAPYVWGATGPSTFDCSGLTYAAYRYAGVTIPRTSYAQAAGLRRAWKMKPGDLLYFSGDSHAAIYVGRNYLIDAPHTGAWVEKVPLSGWLRQTLDAVRSP